MAITGKINVAIHPRTRDRVDKARPSTVSRNEWVDEALNKVLDDLCEELGATDD
jgi:predicted HicB family RNase H-like nuclease